MALHLHRFVGDRGLLVSGTGGDDKTPLSKYEGEVYDCVVLDGSNILSVNMGTRKESKVVYSPERLVRTISAVHRLGWPTHVGMKKGTYNYVMNNSEPEQISEEGRELLSKLVENLGISLIKSKDDDLWLWKVAFDRNGWVLSHDSFNKEIKKYSEADKEEVSLEIKKRRVWLEYVGSEPTFNLPMNHASLIRTSVVSEMRAVEDALRDISEIDAEVIFENSEVGSVRVPIGKPTGRGLFLDLPDKVDSSSVSRNHFIIESKGGEMLLTDLNSKNGTILNGLSIAPDFPCVIPTKEKSAIKVGRLELIITP